MIWAKIPVHQILAWLFTLRGFYSRFKSTKFKSEYLITKDPKSIRIRHHWSNMYRFNPINFSATIAFFKGCEI